MSLFDNLELWIGGVLAAGVAAHFAALWFYRWSYGRLRTAYQGALHEVRPLGHSDRVVESTVLALASWLKVRPGTNVPLSPELVSAYRHLAPWIWWKREGERENEPFRAPDIQDPPELELPRQLLTQGDPRRAYRSLVDVTVRVRRELSFRPPCKGCASGYSIGEIVELAQKILRLGVELSGKVRPEGRYSNWARMTVDITAALTGAWRARREGGV